MPTNQQRREAERRRLQRQLEERRAREAVRKRRTLIGSIVGTVVLIAAVVVIVVVTTSGGSGKNNSAAGGNNPSTTPTPTTSTTPPANPCASAAPSKSVKGPVTTFHGVSITKATATDLKKAPVLTSHARRPPAKLLVKDLVVGKGAKATPSNSVSVQYSGALYCNGTAFDSSWSRGGKPASFSLTQVVPGFTQGIGGTTGVAPMHVGGRRIIIIPASLGYGSQATGSIPANSPLVFVVDLKSISS